MTLEPGPEVRAMPVKYLPQERVDAYNATLAGDDAVRAALTGKTAALQMVRYAGRLQPIVSAYVCVAAGNQCA